MAVVARPSTTSSTLATRTTGLRPGPALHVALFALCVALAAALLAGSAYADRAIPGLTVAGVGVGGLDEPAVRERLGAELSAPWAAATVTAHADGRTFTRTNGELRIEPDLEAAAAAAVAYGKTGAPLDRVRAWAGALRGSSDVAFTMRATGDALERWIAAIASEVDTTPVDGELRSTAFGLAVRQPVIGRQLDRKEAAAAILGAHALGDRSADLVVRAHYPSLDEAGMADAAKALAVASPIEIVADGRGVREDPAGLATLLDVEKVVAKPGELPAIPADAVAPATRYRYHVTFNEQRMKAWTAAVAAVLDRPARNATYTVRSDGSLATVPHQDGVKIDQDAFARAVMDALVRPGAGVRQFTPTFVQDKAIFTTEQAEKYAKDMTRISSYETYYPTNASRYANISTGARQFHDLVIAPGETFSFWKLIGPVTVERGYAYAGAIIDGRSDEHVIGGGLCQVSTTMFNAVARAGYQIVERGSHDYYIDRYPMGLDAAVFDPGLDFKWKNDTGFPVLIRSSSTWNSVAFELFSIPTGRTVTFTDPVQTNFKDVKPDQPADPAFAPGYKVLGRDVSRTRTVTQDGKVIHQDLWLSHYSPVWGGPAR